MALRETPNALDTDLFRQELVNRINPRHPLAQLAQQIDWLGSSPVSNTVPVRMFKVTPAAAVADACCNALSR
jgi:hypothetical protein